MLTLAQLIACGVGPSQARLFIDPINSTFTRFDINTPARMASFIAQAAHESTNFTRLEENLMYTTPERIVRMFRAVPTIADALPLLRNPEALANRVYANRNGNADEASGDGWRYRGRGLFQLTGRANYMAAGEALGIDLKAYPDRVAEPTIAVLTSGWFWSAAGMNVLADSSQIDAITRKINGAAMAGAEDRRSRFDDALRVLSR
jgi:putative chitinase